MNEVGLVPDIMGFESAAAEAAQAIKEARSVLVVGHIDADGITASSIASMALERAGKDYSVRFIKKLDGQEIEKINQEGRDLVWLVDLGSGSFSKLNERKVVVTDHHRPDVARPKGSKVDLFSFTMSNHVNPHLFGLDGSTEVSGAGVTYIVAKAMDARNADLAPLAIIGAVGDFQDSAASRLVGYNRRILDDAISSGGLRAITDIRLFGRETRPIHSLLQFSSDPSLLPVLRATQMTGFRSAESAGDEDKMLCIDFLTLLGIPLREGDRFRCWSQLDQEERMRTVSALCNRILDAGKGVAMIRRLVGEVYVLDRDLPGTPVHWSVGDTGPEYDGSAWHPNVRALQDAKEFATLLNACGRHDRPEVGKAVCLGDRGEKLQEALREQDNHREALKRSIRLVKEDPQFGIREDALANIRYFHGQDQIEDTIVGIVAGMLLGSNDIPSDRPIIAFAEALDGTCSVKVSARGTREHINHGLDLSIAIKEASEKVGGTGGGHNIAAGATIPEGKEKEFLGTIDQIIGRQLTSR